MNHKRFRALSTATLLAWAAVLALPATLGAQEPSREPAAPSSTSAAGQRSDSRTPATTQGGSAQGGAMSSGRGQGGAQGARPGMGMRGQHDMHQGRMMSMECQGMEDCNRRMQQMHLSMLKSGDVDQNFAEMMVRHHQQGIEMARAQVANGRDAQMRQHAEKIIEEQQKEIAELRRLSAQLRSSTSSPASR